MVKVYLKIYFCPIIWHGGSIYDLTKAKLRNTLAHHRDDVQKNLGGRGVDRASATG
jgi:hypothetical protein